MEIGAFNYNAPNTPKSFTTKMIKNRINPAAAYVNSGNPIISSYNQSGYNIPGLSVDFKTIIYFNNLWCAFNNQTSTSYYTSPDGVTWTIRTAPMAVVNNIHRIGSSIYLIPANANPYYTTDGINWNKTQQDPLWTGREDVGIVIFKDKIWIIGGMDKNFEWTNDVWYSTSNIDKK